MSLTLFMFAFLTIISLVNIARTQSVIQYAINQTAKEVSQYYYVADKLNIDFAPKGDTKKIDDLIGSMYSFSNAVDKGYTDTTADINSLKEMPNDISQVRDIVNNATNNLDDIGKATTGVMDSAGAILSDPENVIAGLFEAIKGEFMNEAMSRFIAQPITKALVPKYITASGDADSVLTKLGVENGLKGLDFGMSSFLKDGRTINIVVVYRIKSNIPFFMEDYLVMRQTASTAAWVKGKKLEAVKPSRWDMSDLERGRSFADKLREEDKSKAVKKGNGIDQYDINSNTFTSIHSMNVFRSSYSDYQGQSYTLQENKIKSAVKSYANKAKESMNKIGEEFEMLDGRKVQSALDGVKPRKAALHIVVPDEASGSEHAHILNKIRIEIEQETGVKVEWTYQEKAMGDN